MGMHVVIVGNPVGGFRYYGPFTTGEEGVEWASENLDDYWWTALFKNRPRG